MLEAGPAAPPLPPIGFAAANAITAPMPEVIAAARHGFRRVTAIPGQVRRAVRSGTSLDEMAASLRRAGIECTMLDALSEVFPGVPPVSEAPPELRRILEGAHTDWDTCFGIAEALGIGIVGCNHHRGDPATPLVALRDGLARAVEEAGAHGTRICVEFITGTAIPDLATAAAVTEGFPGAGILLDFFHHSRSGGTVEDIERLRPGALLAVQLSDRIVPPPGTPHVPMRGRLLPGEGELPLAALLDAALRNSPGTTVDLEVLNEELAPLTADEVAARLVAGVRRWTR